MWKVSEVKYFFLQVHHFDAMLRISNATKGVTFSTQHFMRFTCLRENLPLPPILSHAHVTTPQTWCRNIWATSDHHVKKTYTKNWCTGNSKSTLIYKKHFNPIKCRKLIDEMRVNTDCKGYKIMYFLQHISTWLKKNKSTSKSPWCDQMLQNK